ncbi:MAG: hypothetical protein HFJ59_04560 [Clostridia bacterium]|nr:hypothetical protein [Clostridia bacterium]
MKRLIERVLIIVSIILLMVIILKGEVKATLQANPNTHYEKEDMLNNWMVNIRNMEKVGEAMGLSETLKTDLTSASSSNNIDVHLVRNTEYGAVAILSASGYGNPQTLQQSALKTTTGNKTGVYFSGFDLSYECVAGGMSESIIYEHSRYYDKYTSSQDSAKVGDALGNATTANQGCAGWHSASKASWVNGNSTFFVRDLGGLFSFYCYSITRSAYYGRGVAVCGEGL